MRTSSSLFLAIICLLVTSSVASAEHVSLSGFVPFGFYQPYGLSYGTSVRTPPYFATNPPVYYSGRYARPYGLSPFAAPPMLQVSPGYRGELDPATAEIRLPESASHRAVLSRAVQSRAVLYKKQVVPERHGAVDAQPASQKMDPVIGSVIGPVRSNPFALTSKSLVKQ
ncbi:hypothetical protein N9D38_03910 [Rubripirellula sp.]|nr:hypothetical protein [Rubripirellula sp.]